MKERRAEIQYSPCSEKIYVQIYGPSGRKAGDPIDITSQFLGMIIDRIGAHSNGFRIVETIPVAADDSVCLDPNSSQEVKVKLRGTVEKVHTVKIVSVELLPNDEATPAKFVPSHE